MEWNASEFWIDGGCLGNQAHGKRQAYGSISDGRTVERFQFADARTNNEAEYKALSTLLGNLLNKRVDPRKRPTSIYTDSQLLVGHLTQGRKVRAKNLLGLHGEAALGLRKTEAKLIWVPREQIVKLLGH
ncbi:MAG TPA: RNase H family protein [Candidatus Dormibacteraeota bacterium]|nr:RNase H family protein [Candidatus Dormibacteraeota bacterium]